MSSFLEFKKKIWFLTWINDYISPFRACVYVCVQRKKERNTKVFGTLCFFYNTLHFAVFCPGGIH